ncbi:MULTISPECIES: hypothetical protein [Pseudomonas]|uniref:Bile acid:Na+ symporter, BASS family n=1 Tax=Pseudomonas quercus TaxID=2722792 RepID=A0ABX0YIU0_9PSED|nr:MULTISPECIES: hypothetical protein [Pseudomonas]MBF7144313.1 hypothetical protein [Pseudomonas sp. LY10J]NJP02852.1 hypothetical protein [Pseudomonas quercus]
MRRFFLEINRRGPTVLALGCVLGLAAPYIAETFRPLMPAMVFIFILGTFLRIDNSEVLNAIKNIKVSIILPAILVFITPYIFGIGIYGFTENQELSLAIAIAAAAPPASGNAAVARMLGLSPSISVVISLCSMAITPITAPFILYIFGDSLPLSINPLDLATSLLLLICSAEGLAVLIRRFSHDLVSNHGTAIDGIVVTALFIFAIGTMAGMQKIIMADPKNAFTLIAIAYGINLTSQIITGYLYPGPLTLKMTVALNAGNRNIGLMWSALGTSLPPTMILYFACCQLPIHTMPKILQFALPRIRHIYRSKA